MVDHVTFDELRAILAPWFSDQGLALGAKVATPKEAAARAVQAALNTDGERGIVRVLVSSNDQKRSIRNLLEAFFTDEPRLRPWLKRITPDGVELSGGITIMVDTNDARLRHDAIATIVLAPDADTVTAFRRVIVRAGESYVEDPGEQPVVLLLITTPPEWPVDEPIEFVPASAPARSSATTRIEHQGPDPFHRRLAYPPSGVA